MATTTPDVTLARCDGQIWLVGGEQHIDALLIGTLPPDVSVEMVECRNRAAMHALWQERSSGPTAGAQPWILNPLLTQRLLDTLPAARGAGGTVAAVRFTPWSAMLDPAAQEALERAATWARGNPGTVVLRQFTVAEPVPGQADMQRLRGQLAAGALQRAGADPARIREELVPADTAEDADRLLIVTEAPSP